MIKPRALKYGDTIGVVAPASPGTYDKVEMGKRALEEMGFKVKLGKSCFSKYGYLAGKDDLRVEDIHDMFADDGVDGIICLRGGYGTPRILNKINYDIIKENPKVFVGYSDITAIHTAINKICGLVTFHGPMVATDIAKGLDEFSQKSLLGMIGENKELTGVNNPQGEEIKGLYGGRAEGKIVGGNLTMICSTLGTPYEIDTRDKLLFLEDIGEEPYRIDRMLTQLYLAGKFQDVRGIILGYWNNCISESPERSLDLMDVFQDIVLRFKKPTIYNLRAGHCNPNITLPLGVLCTIDADNGKLIIKESATS